MPNQRRGVLVPYGITRLDADHEVWAVEPSGRLFGGAAAANRVLRELPMPWPLVGALYTLRPIGRLEDRVYRWVAAHRGQLARYWGTTPACDEPDEDCE